MLFFTDQHDGVDKEYKHIFFFNRSGGYMGFGLQLDVINEIEWFFKVFIHLPYLIVETVIIVIIQFFVLGHPVRKILELKSSVFDIDVVLFENCACKLLHYMMYTCSLHFHIVVPNFQLDRHRPFVVFFAVKLFQQILTHLALQIIRPALVLQVLEFSTLDFNVYDVAWAHTFQSSSFIFRSYGH